MSYRHATFTGYSHCLASDDGETDHELRVRFAGEVGFETHPYGSTVAHEPITSIEEVTELMIDGTVITEADLEAQFGKEQVQKAVWDAEENASEDE